jgi:hypothetical protein
VSKKCELKALECESIASSLAADDPLRRIYQDLATSMRENRPLEPVIVTQRAGRLVVLDGHHRVAAEITTSALDCHGVTAGFLGQIAPSYQSRYFTLIHIHRDATRSAAAPLPMTSS